jgi:hypothetical protein
MGPRITTTADIRAKCSDRARNRSEPFASVGPDQPAGTRAGLGATPKWPRWLREPPSPMMALHAPGLRRVRTSSSATRISFVLLSWETRRRTLKAFSASML